MTLDNEGFTYQSLGGRPTTHRWLDVEGFFVVEQKALEGAALPHADSGVGISQTV